LLALTLRVRNAERARDVMFSRGAAYLTQSVRASAPVMVMN